jgi:asparagine synthase (glutamine-hydrolysing)
VYIDNVIALGMVRLAILDVSPAGHQPMSTPDRNIWIVYNGEMFNFKDEREILEKKGFSFVSNSDTEVVLRMYEHYGDAFLARMRAMFGLAIYDKRNGPGKERLLLARDNFGIKPLLFSRCGSSLVFASEVKALLASERVAKDIDPESLRLLLTTGSIPQPRTMLKSVRMLLPGHKLIVENQTERIERYWSLDCHRHDELKGQGYVELTEHLRSVLEESVRLQMVSDVPLGAFLSGGIDSSFLVALMAKECSHKVKTFSVGFEQEGAHIDETDDASLIAKHIGTDHTRVLVTGNDVCDKILHLASALDQPSVDGANTYFVSMVASKAVTVAISGTGGDELFAGYPWFASMLRWGQHDKGLSEPIAMARNIAARFARGRIFDRLSVVKGFERIDSVRSMGGFLPRYARLYRIFSPWGAARAIARPLWHLVGIGKEPSSDYMQDECGVDGPVERVSCLCLRGYTQNQLLRDIDAVSMAHSLEVRVPFIDPRLVDIALSMPSETKLGMPDDAKRTISGRYKDTGAKRILIDSGRDCLPPDIDTQSKRGFGMPFGSWLTHQLRDVLEDALSPHSVRKRGFFDEKEVADIRREFFKNPTDWSRPWLLMITELWCRQVLDAGTRR